MNKEQIETRFGVLSTVLVYTGTNNALLSIGEKIVINQERGYLLSLLGETPMHKKTIPNEIEKKVTKIMLLIDLSNWTIKDK